MRQKNSGVKIVPEPPRERNVALEGEHRSLSIQLFGNSLLIPQLTFRFNVKIRHNSMSGALWKNKLKLSKKKIVGKRIWIRPL